MHFLRGFTTLFSPSKHNAFRPHLLERDALVFFLAVILMAEGFYVANVVLAQAVPLLPAAAAVSTAPTQDSFNSIMRQLVRVVTDPRAATGWAIGSVLAVLVVAFVCTLFVHAHIQPVELLVPAALVGGLGALFLFFNAHFAPVLPTASPASVAQSTTGE